MKKIQDKASGLFNRLMHEIASGVYATGMRMPSEREICERDNLSRTTVRSVMNELEAAGLIVRRNRSGQIVTPDAVALAQALIGGSGRKTLHVDWLVDPTDALNPLLQNIFSTVLSYIDDSIQMSLVYLRPEQYADNKARADLLVVCGTDADDEQLRRLSGSVGALVLFNRTSSEFNFVTADHYEGGRLMAEYAIHGSRNPIGSIANLSGRADSDFSTRQRGIAETFAAHGRELLTCQLSPNYFMDYIAISHYLLDLLLRRAPRLDTVLCPLDMLAVGIYESAALRGLKIPDDLGVIGSDDQYFSCHMAPPLTTVKYPTVAIGIKLANFMNELNSGKSTRIAELVKPIFVERESTRHGPACAIAADDASSSGRRTENPPETIRKRQS